MISWFTLILFFFTSLRRLFRLLVEDLQQPSSRVNQKSTVSMNDSRLAPKNSPNAPPKSPVYAIRREIMDITTQICGRG